MSMWNKLYFSLKRYLIPSEFDNEDGFSKVKVLIINLIIPITIIVGFIFIVFHHGYVNNSQKPELLTKLDHAYIYLLALFFIWFRKTKNIKTFTSLYTGLSTTYFFVQYSVTPDVESIIPWFFVYSLFIYMLSPFKNGRVHFAVFSIGIFIISAFRYNDINARFLSYHYLDLFFFAFSIFSLILFISESSRMKLIRRLEKTQSSLQSKNRTLSNTVTELKTTQNSLSIEKETHKTISNTLLTTINNTTDLIWVFSPKGQFELYNDAFKRQVKRSFGISNVTRNLFVELQQHSIGKRLVEIWLERIKYTVESKDKTKFFDKFPTDNKIHYFVTDINPIIENGELTGITCFSKDITSIKVVEKEKEELSRLNNSIVQSIDEIIFDYDIIEDQFTWNEAITPILGLSNEELGTNFDTFAERVNFNQVNQFEDDFNELRKSPGKLNQELHIEGSNGFLWFQLKASTIDINNTSPTRIIGILSCIEEEKSRDALKLQAVMSGIDQERKRVASEIHDSLGQTLIAASLSLNTLNDQIKKSLPEADYEKYNTIEKMINDAIQESRDISHNLMPKSLEDYGLIASIRSLINKINDTNTIEIEYYTNIEINKRFKQNIETNLYRVIQEGLNNVLKHSKAKKVTIQLLLFENTLSLTVEDNGQGFVLDTQESGIGLQNINNRIDAIGGTVNIDSHHDYGTLLTIEVRV